LEYRTSRSLVLLWIWQRKSVFMSGKSTFSILNAHDIKRRCSLLSRTLHAENNEMKSIISEVQIMDIASFYYIFYSTQVRYWFYVLVLQVALSLAFFKTYKIFQNFSNTEISILQSKIIWKAVLSLWSKSPSQTVLISWMQTK
jgi:hypothetical protein